MTDKCPKCGAGKHEDFPDALAWECGTYPRLEEPLLVEGWLCFRRQIAQLQGKLDAAELWVREYEKLATDSREELGVVKAENERLRAIMDMLVPIYEAAVRADPGWSPVHDTAEVPITILSEAAEAVKEDENIPCTCKHSCPPSCKGECGCEACQQAYQDFLSVE